MTLGNKGFQGRRATAKQIETYVDKVKAADSVLFQPLSIGGIKPRGLEAAKYVEYFGLGVVNVLLALRYKINMFAEGEIGFLLRRRESFV